ncbi:MAG: hypothetical protein WDZ31_01080 [Phycisphaeraceae bacterium]
MEMASNRNKLISKRRVIEVARALRARNPEMQTLHEIRDLEPELARWARVEIAQATQTLRQEGVDEQVVDELEKAGYWIVALAMHAIRDGHFSLWRRSMTGTRLAALDPDLSQSSRRRKKGK